MVMRQEEVQDNDSGLDSYGRLNTSIFYGENTDKWVSEAEEIFSRNQLSEVEKIEAATSCFGSEEWDWFWQIDDQRPVRTWKELKWLMLDQFHRKEVSMVEEIRAHKSETNINGYQLEVQEDLKTEIKKAMSIMMEKFDSMREKNGRVGAEKVSTTASLETIFNSENTLESYEIGAITDNLNCREEHEPERKKKGQATTLPYAPINSEVPPKFEESGASIDGRNHHVVVVEKMETRSPRLDRLPEIPVSPLSALPEDALEGNGIKGLKQGKLLKPKGLGHIIKLAQPVEDRTKYLKHAQLNFGPFRIKLNSSSSPVSYSPHNSTYGTPSNNASPFTGHSRTHDSTPVTVPQPAITAKGVPSFKRLTDVELQGKGKKRSAVSYPLISVRRVQKLEKLLVESTGYGVALDTILAIIARLSKFTRFKGLTNSFLVVTMTGVLARKMAWLHDELTKTAIASTLRTRWIWSGG